MDDNLKDRIILDGWNIYNIACLDFHSDFWQSDVVMRAVFHVLPFGERSKMLVES